MKRSLILAVCLLLSSFTLPLAICTPPATAAATAAPAVTTIPAASSVQSQRAELPTPVAVERIAVLADGVSTQMTLEEVVEAIVAAEMPALFPEEALRAQAIAARTYLCYRALHPVSAHPSEVICDNPAHCCALADLNALAAGWGEQGSTYADRIRNAVSSTAGQLLTYADAPILAVFHAMSAGTTNSSADVWGGSVPYLVSVAAPEGEAELNGWSQSMVFDADEFRRMFLQRYPDAVLKDGTDWFTSIDRTEGGLVRTVCIGGVSVTGGTLRSLCGLRSASFTVTQGSGRIRFDTQGYGHGVGMSQNGAKVLALAGYDADRILAYYYPGTTPADVADVLPGSVG